MIDSHMYNTTYFNRGRETVSHTTMIDSHMYNTNTLIEGEILYHTQHTNYDLDCNLSDDLFMNSILQ